MFLEGARNDLTLLWEKALRGDAGYQHIIEETLYGWRLENDRLVRPGEQGWVILVSHYYELWTVLLAFTHDLPIAEHFGRTKTLSVLR